LETKKRKHPNQREWRGEGEDSRKNERRRKKGTRAFYNSRHNPLRKRRRRKEKVCKGGDEARFGRSEGR